MVDSQQKDRKRTKDLFCQPAAPAKIALAGAAGWLENSSSAVPFASGAPARHVPPRSHGTRRCPDGTRTYRASALPAPAAPRACRSVRALLQHAGRAAPRQQVPFWESPAGTRVLADSGASATKAAWPAPAAGLARTPRPVAPIL